MTSEVAQFIELVRNFDEKCLNTWMIANQEYAKDTNIFNNFEVIAYILSKINPRLREMQPQDCAMVYMMKHLISIFQEVSKRESMESRFVDVCNYLKILYAMGETRK